MGPQKQNMCEKIKSEHYRQVSLYLTITRNFKYSGKNATFLNTTCGGPYSYHWTFKWLNTVFMATNLPSFDVICHHWYDKLHINTVVLQRSQNPLH
jgi:hypothetical protein